MSLNAVELRNSGITVTQYTEIMQNFTINNRIQVGNPEGLWF